MSTDNEYTPFGADEIAEAPIESAEEPVEVTLIDQEPDNEEPTPLALIENDEAEEPDPDDILGSPEFAELPEQNQKGVLKLVERAKAKEAEVEAKLAGADYLLNYARRLQDPNDYQNAINDIIAETRQLHGATQPDPESYQADGESKYGLAFASDDIILERAIEAAERRIMEKLDPDLKYVRQAQAERGIVERVSQVAPTIKAKYGEWVTDDLVRQAVQAHPSLPPDKAFGAEHALLIAKKFAEYGSSRNKAPKQINPTGITARSEKVYKEGDYVPFEAVVTEFSS